MARKPAASHGSSRQSGASAPPFPGPGQGQGKGRGPKGGPRGGKATRGGRAVAGGAASGLPWLFGRHPVEAALANPEREIERFLALPGAADDLPPGSLPPEPVTRDQLEALLPPGAVHQGLALLARPLEQPALEAVAAQAGPAVICVLDQVSDPHNVGAILRSASAFGAAAVVVQDRHSPDETGTLAKSASGALERMPLVRVANIARALDTLKENGFWALGLDARAEVSISDSAISGPDAPERRVLVLGSEGSGLRRLVRDHCDTLISLPMTGAMESLNVSNAAAVALYALLAPRLAGRG